MLRCGCGMMIECEIKTGQTVEFIENIRREGSNGVVVKIKRENFGMISNR